MAIEEDGCFMNFTSLGGIVHRIRGWRLAHDRVSQAKGNGVLQEQASGCHGCGMLHLIVMFLSTGMVEAGSVYQDYLKDVSPCLETPGESLDNRLNTLIRWN